MLDLLMVSMVFSFLIISLIKEQRNHILYKKLWLPLTIIAVVTLLYGKYFADKDITVKYSYKVVKENVYTADNNLHKVYISECRKYTINTRNLNYWPMIEILERGIKLPEGVLVDLKNCEEN